MSQNRRIPYGRMEEIRRLNQKIEETSDEWEKEMYQKAKKIRVPYERLDTILQECREKIISAQRKKQRKRYIRLAITVITILILCLLLLMIPSSGNNVG